ncbi:MAG: Hsp20/alpha crystallin family protein [Melioribacteraceae bacterium]|nr:Hsp20/alpha crystallin family protein [Melioribacteraceae bacterium]
MTLVRWNPARELSNVEREFNKFWNNFGLTQNEETDNSVWSPLTDISEDKDNYYINTDLPGISKENLKLNITDGELTISGERNQIKEEKEKTFHRIERNYGKYYRKFNLPEKIVTDKIDAKFKDGQLIIVIPKAEESKPRELEIKIN